MKRSDAQEFARLTRQLQAAVGTPQTPGPELLGQFQSWSRARQLRELHSIRDLCIGRTKELP